MAGYGRKDYWDDRYSKDNDYFDWFVTTRDLQGILEKYVKKDHKILNVGAGNSKLAEEMYDEGYQTITNIDVSANVVKSMSEKNAGKDGLVYTVMNVLSLHFTEKSFDVVIDKGTFDTIACGENSTNNMDKTLREISRVLKSGGKYILISFAPVEMRTPFLDKPRYEWTIEQSTIPKPTAPGITHENLSDPGVYYVYVLTKK